MIGAVDIGGTKIAVGMVDDAGKVLSRMQAPTDPDRYASGIDDIARMLRETAGKAGVEITGIGIGSTGPVDPMKGEFGDVDFLPGWRGKSPERVVAEMQSLPRAHVQRLCWTRAANANCWVLSNSSSLRGCPCKVSRRSLTMAAS